MFNWLKSLWQGPRPKSPLRMELDRLNVKFAREENHLRQVEQQFWNRGGVCCPYCGILGFQEAKNVQERRAARIAYIEKKLHLHN